MMERYRVTPEEIFIIDLLFQASSEEGHPEYLYRYLSMPNEKSDFRSVLLSLQDKGVITKECKIPEKGSKFDPESIIFNKNFLHNYRKFSGDLGYELMKHYPSIAIINGLEYNIQNFAKRFHSVEEFMFAYGKSIGWNLNTHQKVIKLIDWAKENKSNLLNLNIADFVIIKGWEKIEEFKNNSFDALVIDNIKDV